MSKKLYLKEYEGSIRLGAAHSLITGHGPRLAAMEKEAIQRKLEIANLGLFETSSPDFNTYYPNATAEDLEPKEGEFIRPVYRALSEVVVRKNVDPLDFSQDNVLKASMSLLEAQTVYVNHDAFIGNEIGVVSKVFWDPGHVANGIKVPAGINAEFLIDGKAHPNLARKILMNPPAVHSNSVTVNFKWTPSHPKLSLDEFRAKVGTFDDKGVLIRRVVSEITAYYETSLVSHGADPYAKQIRDGKIVSPEFSHARDSFSESIPESKPFFMFSYKDSLSEITIPEKLNNNETGTEEENKPQKTMKKDTIILLAMLLGYEISAEQLAMPEEEFQEAFDLESFEASVAEQLSGKDQTIKKLVDDKTAAEAEVERLKAENHTLSASADEIVQMKADLLAEVKRLYESASGKQATENLMATFQKADYAALKSFQELYKTQLEEAYPAKCAKCGSTDVSRNSTNPEHQEEGGNQGVSTLTAQELARKIRDGQIKLDPDRDY